MHYDSSGTPTKWSQINRSNTIGYSHKRPSQEQKSVHRVSFHGSIMGNGAPSRPQNNKRERAECTASAFVMIYDDQMKKWKPAGTGQGCISRVSVYLHTENKTYRVVGRKDDPSREVVINCSIHKQLKYNIATPTFHQWRDSRSVYGLNFQSKEDADNFSACMLNAVEQLSQPQGPSRAELEAQRMEKERIERENMERARQEQERREREMRQAQQQQQQASAGPPPPPAAPSGGGPPPPPPPPSGGPPPPPPAPKAGGGPPPPPPAPSGGGGGGGGGGLAAALAGAKLKKTEPPPEKAPISSGGGGGGGGVDLMGELQQRMLAKKKRAEQSAAASESNGGGGGVVINSAPKPAAPATETKRTWGTKNTGLSSANSSTGSLGRSKTQNTSNGTSSADLEAVKQEIISEMRAEIRKMKEEIIQAIREGQNQ